MVQVTRYDFASLLRQRPLSDRAPREPRLVLHASVTHFYWILIFLAVSALVALPGGLYRVWGEQRGSHVVVFGLVAALFLFLFIAYCERKARWLVADARGLSITERTTVRTFAWREVRALLDLGSLGSAPSARRFYIELPNDEFFTFLADPEAMRRLEELRPRWEASERANGKVG